MKMEPCKACGEDVDASDKKLVWRGRRYCEDCLKELSTGDISGAVQAVLYRNDEVASGKYRAYRSQVAGQRTGVSRTSGG